MKAFFPLGTVGAARRLVAALLLVATLLAGPAGRAAAQDATPTPDPLPPTTVPAEATPPPAPPAVWLSPTPDATGAILVVVQPDESLWAIAARAGLTLPDLLALNGLSESAIIQPGQTLIIGYGTPNAGVVPVEQQTATPTSPPPTLRPTLERPKAAICISAFDDLNQNALRDEGEPLRAGVAFTIFNTEAVVANYITDGVSEPKCLDGLPPGQYHVTRSIRPGERLTTDGNWALVLTADSVLRQDFGSIPSAGGEPASVTAAATQAAIAAGPGTTALQAGATPTPAAAEIEGPLSGARSLGVIVLAAAGLLAAAAVLILLVRQQRARP